MKYYESEDRNGRRRKGVSKNCVSARSCGSFFRWKISIGTRKRAVEFIAWDLHLRIAVASRYLSPPPCSASDLELNCLSPRCKTSSRFVFAAYDFLGTRTGQPFFSSRRAALRYVVFLSRGDIICRCRFFAWWFFYMSGSFSLLNVLIRLKFFDTRSRKTLNKRTAEFRLYYFNVKVLYRIVAHYIL